MAAAFHPVAILRHPILLWPALLQGNRVGFPLPPCSVETSPGLGKRLVAMGEFVGGGHLGQAAGLFLFLVVYGMEERTVHGSGQ